MNIRLFTSVLLLLSLQFTAQSALAVPNVLGTYTGTSTYTVSACSPTPGGFGGTGPIDADVTFQSGSSFSGTATANTVPGTFSGTVDASGNVTGTWTASGTVAPNTYNFTAGTFSGNLTGDTLTLSRVAIVNITPSGDTCTFNDTATLTRLPVAPASEPGAIDPENAPGNLITNGATALTQVIYVTTGVLGARVQDALHGTQGGPRQVPQGYMLETPTGLSAGDTFDNIGIWGSYAYSNFDNDFSRTRYDGRRYMLFGGVDFSPRDDMVLGVALSYEDSNIDTDFNFGKLKADGWTIAPYFGMILNDTWNIDVSAGISNIDTDQNRTNGTISSNVDTDRWFISANINGFTQVDNWLLTGRAGLLNAESDDDGFTETGVGGLTVASTKTLLTQFNIGGEVAYAVGNFEPFVSAYYNNDLHASETILTVGAQPSNDHDDVLLGIGFRYFSDDDLSISAQIDSRQGRSDIDENTFSVNARWDF